MTSSNMMRVTKDYSFITALKLILFILYTAPASEGWGSISGLGTTGSNSKASRHGDLPKLSRHLRYLLFPETGAMGLFLALAIPLDLPHKSVSISWNFEANYVLPYNASELADPPLVFRDNAKAEGRHGRETDSPTAMDRTRFYALLETHLRSAGLPARPCLLRAICEAAETPLRHNGLVGDILHVLLSPSTSEYEGLPPEFDEAERQGKDGKNCEEVHALSCPVSILGLVSVVIENDVD